MDRTGNGRSGPQFVDQQTRRQPSLVSPVLFYQALGTSDTTIYTGKDDRYFLIRNIAVENTTGGAVNLTLTVGGNDWVTGESVAANKTTGKLNGLDGMLVDAGDDISGLGSATGLVVFGWGLRIEGDAGWVL